MIKDLACDRYPGRCSSAAQNAAAGMTSEAKVKPRTMRTLKTELSKALPVAARHGAFSYVRGYIFSSAPLV